MPEEDSSTGQGADVHLSQSLEDNLLAVGAFPASSLLHLMSDSALAAAAALTLHIWMVWASSMMKQQARAMVATVRSTKYRELVRPLLPLSYQPHWPTMLVTASHTAEQSCSSFRGVKGLAPETQGSALVARVRVLERQESEGLVTLLMLRPLRMRRRRTGLGWQEEPARREQTCTSTGRDEGGWYGQVRVQLDKTSCIWSGI